MSKPFANDICKLLSHQHFLMSNLKRAHDHLQKVISSHQHFFGHSFALVTSMPEMPCAHCLVSRRASRTVQFAEKSVLCTQAGRENSQHLKKTFYPVNIFENLPFIISRYCSISLRCRFTSIQLGKLTIENFLSYAVIRKCRYL